MERELEKAAAALSAANAPTNLNNDFEEEVTTANLDMADLPTSPSWSNSTPTCTTEEELKQMVLNGEIPTAIADSGASSSVGKPMISTCGDYVINADPLIHTGRKSNKTFQYGGGTVAPASEIKEYPFDVRGEAKEVHMVPGTQNHLMSTNTSTNENLYGEGLIKQYPKTGAAPIAIYKFINIFPVNMSEITLGWDANDAIEEYTVEFAYDYWSHTGGTPGGAVAGTVN